MSERRVSDKTFLGFHFDYTLNIQSILSIAVLIYTMMHYGSQVMDYLRSIDARTNIMWAHFDKSTMTKEELIKLGIN